MKTNFLIIILLLSILFSCKDSERESIEVRSREFTTSLDSIMYLNYLNAIENQSTLQYFTVVKIRNLNNKETREICTKGNFLAGALHREYKLGYSIDEIIKVQNLLSENKERYFEFKDTSAINNLDLNKYSVEEFEKFEKETNRDSISKSIINKDWSMHFEDDKTMLIFAHSLFNRGILTGENNSFGGTIYHITESMLEERKAQTGRLKSTNVDK